MRRSRREEHIRGLLRKLLTSREKFFHKGVLNSDGRKVLEEIIKHVAATHPEHMEAARRARRDPCLENILRLARLYLGSEADEIIASWTRGPYRYGADDT